MRTLLKKRTQHEVALIAVSTLLLVIVAVVVLIGDVRLFFMQLGQNVWETASKRAAGIRIPSSAVISTLIVAAIWLFYEVGRRLALQAFPRHHKEEFCPRCGQDIHMIHRTWADRLASFVLRGHFQRYRCFHCGWSGLHRQRKRRK